MDFITGLPPSRGHDAILVVVDHGLTKGVVFIPCNKTTDAPQTTQLYQNHVYRRFGLPQKTISDRGSVFTAAFTRELGKLLGIKLAFSTAYHPQSDGETERVNQELEAYLRIYCGNNPEAWADHLLDAEFAHNQRIHSARNASPFFLMMGYDPVAIPTAYPNTNYPTLQHRLSTIQKARDEALAAHELARQVMRQRITKTFVPFKKGKQVWLDCQNLKLPYPNRKLAPKREGPFVIKEALNTLNYRLKLPKAWKIHPVFHAGFLSHYRENDTHGPNYAQPPPDLIDEDDHEEYEVEAIIAHKGNRGSRRFLVKWKGYSSAENSWEPEDHLGNASEILKRYKKTHRL